ncbi:hypothetical protein [Sphingopyxis sp.]|uniref:hypothetical protein n=1 Tax=Sphingopyxis sp. TaxID=1908224 RepID=UPI003D0AE84F
MTAKRQTAAAANVMTVQANEGESEAETMARVMVAPFMRHGIVAKGLTDKMAGKPPGDPQFDHFANVIKTKAELASKGDTTLASQLLTAQALSLDAMFTELARRATLNFGDYPLAAERYARLAFKAQANCRASLEALAKLHQPREQTVRHVHVNEGGQAVIADEIHHHGGKVENEKFGKQSHATGTTGEGAALPCTDASGNGVPIASGSR